MEEHNSTKVEITVRVCLSVQKLYFCIMERKINEEVKKFLKPSITHYEWEEDGKKYSSWKINTGSYTINTGDAGMKLFEEAMKKQFEKYLK